MATLSDTINKLGGNIVYDERTKRFHDLTTNYKMVSSEQALRQITPGRPSRDGVTSQYVSQTSFDALRRDVYAMMSSIAQNAYLASNELKKSLEAQRKDTESLRKYENQVNEDRLEGIPRPGMMERIGGIAGAVGRGTRRAIGIAPYAIGGLGLAGLAAALAATLLSPETVRELDEAQEEIQRVVSGVSRLATDIYNLRSEILLMAEIAGTVIGGLLGIRAINRFANRAAGRIQSSSAYQRMSSALQRMFNFNRAPPTPPATPSTSPSSAARPPAAANMNQPRVRPALGPAQSSIPRPGNMIGRPPTPANDPNRGVTRLAPPPRQPPPPPPPPPERVQTPAPGGRAPISGRPSRIPGAGILRLAGFAGLMISLAPSIHYYITTTAEQREIREIEELGEIAVNRARQYHEATLEFDRLNNLEESDPTRSTIALRTQINLRASSLRELNNDIRRLENFRGNAARLLVIQQNRLRRLTEEFNRNPQQFPESMLDEARQGLDLQNRRIELADVYLLEAKGLQQTAVYDEARMVRNTTGRAGRPELAREMSARGAGILTEDQRQQAIIALGQGRLTPQELARQIQAGVIALPPIEVRRPNQPTSPPPVPGGGGHPAEPQARPSPGSLPGAATGWPRR